MRVPRISFKRKVAISVLAGGLVLAAAGIATATFTGTGHGTGHAPIAKLSPTAWKITQVGETGALYPVTATPPYTPPWPPAVGHVTPIGPYAQVEFQVTNATRGLLGLPAGYLPTASFTGFVGPTTPVGTPAHAFPSCHPTWIKDVVQITGNDTRVKVGAFFDVFVDISLVTSAAAPAVQDGCQGLMPYFTLNIAVP